MSDGIPHRWLDEAAFVRLRDSVPAVAEEAVATIVREVPSYSRAFTGAMGAAIRSAVQLALVNFLELARSGNTGSAAEPIAPSTAGAYELGRGEARSGRSMDALLAAYRVGARVSWRGLSHEAVAAGVSAQTLGSFAELVFAYIDALSAASLAGHADELRLLGRARERERERLAVMVVRGAQETALAEVAVRAEWTPPRTLTAVLLPEGQARAVLGSLDGRTLIASTDLPGVAEGQAVLLVPDLAGRDRERLLRQLDGRGAIVGPERPWLQARSSFTRVVRGQSLPRPAGRATLDTDTQLVTLLLNADPEALADLAEQALAPLAGQRPATRARLEETLRAWLLLHGRRELVAEALYVHPQTVRYRMAQLRELFGDRLDDPEEVLRLTLALAGTRPAAPPGATAGAAAAAAAGAAQRPHGAQRAAAAQAAQLSTSLRRKVR
ncbi:MAG: helix-turn-helix domain-containing protein [Actinomycetales bacterium]|nr:helix-turn-helix domain-containing protein [Actinomycetales bacterium]